VGGEGHGGPQGEEVDGEGGVAEGGRGGNGGSWELARGAGLVGARRRLGNGKWEGLGGEGGGGIVRIAE
jgi:hypothetical protein